ncbi:MAG: isochorismatase family protein [Oscillospiraceae bacterium]
MSSIIILHHFACGLLVKTDNVFCKEQADLFSSEELLAFLKSKNISDVEIIGIDGNSCISASAKGAIKKGYVVSVDLDCIGVANPLRFEKTKETLSVMGVILKQS